MDADEENDQDVPSDTDLEDSEDSDDSDDDGE